MTYPSNLDKGIIIYTCPTCILLHRRKDTKLLFTIYMYTRLYEDCDKCTKYSVHCHVIQVKL